MEAGDPGKGGGFVVSGFFQEDGVEVVGVALAIEVRQTIEPLVAPKGPVGQLLGEGVLGNELEECDEVPPEVGGSTGLESQDEGPVVVVADVQHGSAGEEGIACHTQGGLREVAFQGWSESGEGVEFTVLFDFLVSRQRDWFLAIGLGERGPGDGILDELRAHGKRQTAGGDELGL